MKIYIKSKLYADDVFKDGSDNPNRCLIFFSQIRDGPVVHDRFVFGGPTIIVSGGDEFVHIDSLGSATIPYVDYFDKTKKIKVTELSFVAKMVIKAYGDEKYPLRVICDYRDKGPLDMYAYRIEHEEV